MAMQAQSGSYKALLGRTAHSANVKPMRSSRDLTHETPEVRPPSSVVTFAIAPASIDGCVDAAQDAHAAHAVNANTTVGREWLTADGAAASATRSSLRSR